MERKYIECCWICGNKVFGGTQYSGAFKRIRFVCYKCEKYKEVEEIIALDRKINYLQDLEKLSQENRCSFKLYSDYCKKEGFPFCDKHKKERCVKCGRQATRICPVAHTLGVCGYPLCNDCEHNC